LTLRPDGGRLGGDKLSPVAQLARMFGHELGEIVALLDGYTEMLRPSAGDDAVSGLRRATERLRTDCEDLLELIGLAAAPPAPTRIDPAAALAAAQRQLRARDPANAELSIDVPALPPVHVDPNELGHLFVHLLRSLASTGHLRGPGRLVVRGWREGTEVSLEIGADGAARRPADLQRARSSVARTLELAIASHFAERNGGLLRIGKSRSGPVISLTLPAADR
jgi:hypothetical protein